VTAPGLDLTAAYTAQQAATRTTVLSYLAALWAALTSWRSLDAAAFVAQAVPVITGGQQRTAALTAAYLAHVVRDGGGTPSAPDLGGMSDEDLRGVPATEVYRRPFTQLWTDLSQGKPLDQAVASAGQRVQSLSATDLQLAKTTASQRILSSSAGVTGYRRVLTGDHSCALCLIASTQRYHRAQLLPIHPQCDCGVLPIFGDHDPGQVIDPDLLGAIHDAVATGLGPQYVDSGARSPQDYRKVLITHQHGELGPVLAVRGQKFTGSTDLPDGRP